MLVYLVWAAGMLLCYAKSLQSCPTLCDSIDGSPPGSPVPGILQTRTLEWVAISFSNAWKWSRSVMSDSLWPHGLQPSRLLRPQDFPGKSTGVGCHLLLLCSTTFLPFLQKTGRILGNACQRCCFDLDSDPGVLNHSVIPEYRKTWPLIQIPLPPMVCDI